jgi:hypothetical protein
VLLEVELEELLDEPRRDAAVEGRMVLLEAQHGAKRELPLTLRDIAVDDDEPGRARFLRRGLEAPQQERRVPAGKRALPGCDRRAGRGEQARALLRPRGVRRWRRFLRRGRAGAGQDEQRKSEAHHRILN